MVTWEDRVHRVEDAVAGWRPRLVDPPTVEPGSSLAGDDEVFPALGCSHLAWWGLAVAVEHLDAGLRLLRSQVAAGGPLFGDANYTVLRAALLGASQAAVLLLPTERKVRTTYGLQLAHEEFRRALNFRTHLRDRGGAPVEDALHAGDPTFFDSVHDPMSRAAAALEVRKARKSLPDTDVIDLAAGLVHQRGPDARLLQLGQEMEWRLASGSAHGQLVVSMHRTGGHRVEGNMAMFAGNYDDIAQAVGRVALVTSEAWRVWDLRRLR